MRSKRSETATQVGAFPSGSASALDPGTDLCIVSWNVHKLLHDGIYDEFEDMIEQRAPDLLALQEARAHMAVPTGMAGHYGHSFRSGVLGRTDEGVVTLSTIEPTRTYRVRSQERELYVLTPKAALLSMFAVEDGRELCVVNLHGLNFDPTGGQLARQLDGLRERVEGFQGPLIVAGDFNTWNEPRMEAVESLRRSLGLIEVKPDYPGGKTGDVPPGLMSKALGFNPEMHLDRIFVRGFRPIQVSWMMEYRASDHVPILARLEWT